MGASRPSQEHTGQVTRFATLDEAAVRAIAALLRVPVQTAPYHVHGQPVYQLVVRNRALDCDLSVILWPALNRIDVRIGPPEGGAMVFKAISSIEIYPGIEVMFRRTDPPSHLFISISGRVEMVV